MDTRRPSPLPGLQGVISCLPNLDEEEGELTPNDADIPDSIARALLDAVQENCRYFQHAHFIPKVVWEREVHINWSMVTARVALVRRYLEVYWPCVGGLSAVNAIGTQLRDTINSGLTRWRVAVLNK